MSHVDRSSEHLIAFLRELNRTRNLEALAQVVIEHAVALVPGAQRGSFMLLNRERGCYEFRAAVGWDMEKLRHVCIPEAKALQKIVYGDHPAIIREPYRQNYVHGLGELGDTFRDMFGPDQAILSFPISYEGEVIAYLNLDNVEDPHAFREEDFQLLAVVEEEIAVALRAVLGRERLAELERFFRLLFERLADAVYITEFDGTIVRANQAASEQSGYTADELVGMNVMHDLAHQEPKMTYQQAIDLLEEGEIVRFEEVKRRKDGSLYVTECAVTRFEYRGRQVTLSVNRDITERREAERNLERRNREQEALLAASRPLTATLHLDELLSRIQEQAASLLSCDSFFVALLDKRRKKLRLELMVERGASLGKHTVDADPEGSLTAWVAHTGRSLLIRDTESEPLPAPFRQVGEPTRSWLGVPLLVKGEVVGVMSVQSLSPHAFSEDDRQLLAAFGGLAAAAISNAELHTGMATLQGKLLAVERAARGMKLAETKAELYRCLVEATGEIFGYEACGIFEAEEGALRAAVLQEGELSLGKRLPIDGPGITVAAWNEGKTLYVPDVSADERYLKGVPETKSELSVPFGEGARQVGVFNVESPVERGIPLEDRNLLEIMVSHMAASLSGLERLEAVRSLSAKLERLHHAVDEMQRCTDVEGLCHTSVRIASEVLGMSMCGIGLAQGEYLVPVSSSGGADELGRAIRRGEGVAGKTWEGGRTMWGKVSDFPVAELVTPEIKGVISVPVGHEGVFQALTSSEEGFTSADVTLAEILVGHLLGELERIRLEEALREQATQDALTGLYNRRFLSEVLEREMTRAKRYGHPISVIMADIDDFKQVNDRLGHLKGDEVLREVAALLRDSVRDSDYVFRYGGEEFVILMPETEDRAGEAIARLRAAVERWAKSAELGDLQFGLTMGSAVWDPRSEQEATPESVLQRADQVLYGFKRSKGR